MLTLATIPVISAASAGIVLDAARSAMDAGRPGLAEQLCRALLDVQPELAAGWNLLGNLVWRAGLPAPAVGHLRRAVELAAEPGFAADLRRATAELARLPPARARAPALPADPPHFLVVRSWREGLFSDLDHVLGALLLAEATGRIPIVHWGNESAYAAPDGRDLFGRLFEPLSPTALDELPWEPGEVFPHPWAEAGRSAMLERFRGPGSLVGAIDLLARSERVVVTHVHLSVHLLRHWLPAGHPLHGLPTAAVHHELLRRRLRVRPHLPDRARRFLLPHAEPGRFVAAHVRGTDKRHEQRLAAVNAAYADRIDRMLATMPDAPLFVMTDDADELARLQSRYGRRVFASDSLRARGPVGLHRIEAARGPALAEEVLVDALVAMQAAAFVGNARSNVSRFVRHAARWPEDRLCLLDAADPPPEEHHYLWDIICRAFVPPQFAAPGAAGPRLPPGRA